MVRGGRGSYAGAVMKGMIKGCQRSVEVKIWLEDAVQVGRHDACSISVQCLHVAFMNPWLILLLCSMSGLC